MGGTVMATSNFPKTAYVIKISLLGIKPIIWRRFCVPGEISLDRLHEVVQIVMGWQDCHLHHFEIDGQRYTESPENPEAEGQDEAGFKLSDIISQDKAKFVYEYDFGDGWQHALVIENIQPISSGGVACIGCMDGKRNCPPENVGGIDGYNEFLAAICNPKNPEYDTYREWSGGSFDPNVFDSDLINFELARYVRWSRSRAIDQDFVVQGFADV